MRKRVIHFLVGLLGAGGIAAYVIYDISESHREDETRQSIGLIQLALERYAEDDPHHFYPKDPDELKKHGYLDEYPLNSYTGQPMRLVANGDQSTPGDFSMLVTPSTMCKNKCKGYTLIAYGRRQKNRHLLERSIKSQYPNAADYEWNKVMVLLVNGKSH
jgi:hypothetical protein